MEYISKNSRHASIEAIWHHCIWMISKHFHLEKLITHDTHISQKSNIYVAQDYKVVFCTDIRPLDIQIH